MANIFIKYDENSETVGKILETYVRKMTVHNLSVKEKNADFCVYLQIPPYPAEQRFNAHYYNNQNNLEDLCNKIYYQCSKADIKTRPLSKKSMPREKYELSFLTPTLVINLTNDITEFDEEVYALVIGQGIVSHLSPGTVFDTFSEKDKIKKSGEKRYIDRKFINEPTGNSKLLFKKK
jgi:hypothetical protein